MLDTAQEQTKEQTMTEGEARAYITERLKLYETCKCSIGFSEADDYKCADCHGVGVMAVNWHVWEDLIPAMEKQGWGVGYLGGLESAWPGWSFWKGAIEVHDRDPIIAAALALQQEERDA